MKVNDQQRKIREQRVTWGLGLQLIFSKDIFLEPEKRISESAAKAAIFYSIVTTQPGKHESYSWSYLLFIIGYSGLKGIDLPQRLIESTARHLHHQYNGFDPTSPLTLCWVVFIWCSFPNRHIWVFYTFSDPGLHVLVAAVANLWEQAHNIWSQR